MLFRRGLASPEMFRNVRRKAGGFPHIKRRSRRLQRIYDLPKLIFAKSLERLSTDITLRTEAEHALRIGFVIRGFDHADEIIATHRKISLFDFHSCLLEGLPAGVEPRRTTFDSRNPLFRPVQQCNVSWHSFFLSLVSEARPSGRATLGHLPSLTVGLLTRSDLNNHILPKQQPH